MRILENLIWVFRKPYIIISYENVDATMFAITIAKYINFKIMIFK